MRCEHVLAQAPGVSVAHVVDPPLHTGIQLGKYLIPRHSSESWNPYDLSA